MKDLEQQSPRRAEPIFDLPPIVTGLVVIMGLLTLARGLISPDADLRLMAAFAFIPDRYILEEGAPAYPGGWGAMAWTFLSHAFLHDGWMHFGMNAAMMAAIGRVLAIRIGTTRFVMFFAFAAAVGALVHLGLDWGSGVPVIGASGAVMGLLGSLLRFAFGARPWSPPLTVVAALRTPRVQSMIGALVVLNVILVLLGTRPFGGSGGGIAWTVHVGGFLAGFLGFSLFDRPALRQSGSRW